MVTGKSNMARRSLLLCVCVVVAGCVTALPLHARSEEEVSEVPSHLSARQAATCEDMVPEPQVPLVVPDWALGISSTDLVKTDGVLQLGAHLFAKGTEMVIKKCNPTSLHAAVSYSEPELNPDKGDVDPVWDIYFDCGDNSKYVIYIKETLIFGRGAKTAFGRYQLIAPQQNVELNGRRKYRIIRVMDSAKLTVAGLTFQHGWQVNWESDLDKVPSGGWTGGAIQASWSSTLIAYKCKFIKNQSISYFARWGMGGAIKAETNSKVTVWGCYFEKNVASTGGAVAASSAQSLHIAHCSFFKNTASGGVDPSSVKQGHAIPKLMVKGGAARVDSVEGYEHSDEHVIFCGCDFESNKLKLMEKHLAKFGYPTYDTSNVRITGLAVAAWNSEGNLNLEAGDHHFLSSRGCTFKGNKYKSDIIGEKTGAYVFQVEGAGHVDIESMKFIDNQVAHAVTRFDNSNKYGVDYELSMKDVSFDGNGEAFNIMFEAAQNDSTCSLENVEGLPNGTSDCFKAAMAAEEEGESIEIVDPGVIDDGAPQDDGSSTDGGDSGAGGDSGTDGDDGADGSGGLGGFNPTIIDE